MKAITGNLDSDLAFEAADVMIDEASINGHAFISGTQLRENKSNLRAPFWPFYHLIIYLTPRDPHVALAVHHGTLLYAYIVQIPLSVSANKGPIVPSILVFMASTSIQACIWWASGSSCLLQYCTILRTLTTL